MDHYADDLAAVTALLDLHGAEAMRCLPSRGPL
jgi:hypothetical protein